MNWILLLLWHSLKFCRLLEEFWIFGEPLPRFPNCLNCCPSLLVLELTSLESSFESIRIRRLLRATLSAVVTEKRIIV